MAQQESKSIFQQLKEFFAGKPEVLEQISKVSPQQEKLQQQIISAIQPLLQQQTGDAQGQDLLGQLTGRAQQMRPQLDFAPIAAEARRGFQEQTVPTLAERFTSMGEGARGSSAFGQQLGAAGAGLESQLAALGSKYGLQQQQMLNQLAGLQSERQLGQQRGQTQRLATLLSGGMTPTFENIMRPGTSGLLGNIGQGVGYAGARLGLGSLGL